MIRIRYFASLRERLGTSGEELEAGEDLQTVADLTARLRERGAPWAEVLAEGETLMTAVNQEIAQPGARVNDGDEVAFFPPVTGG